MAEPNTNPRPTFSPDQAIDRPTSPHLQIWKWAVTMAMSITHRATGIALYGGSVLFTLWLLAAVVSEDLYNMMMGIMGSAFGMLILIGFTWAMMFHLVNGVKYLFWDAGKLLDKDVANKVGWIVYIASVVLTAIIWAIALGMKG